MFVFRDHGSHGSKHLVESLEVGYRSFMILFPREPTAGTWQITRLKKKQLPNPPFLGFHVSFFGVVQYIIHFFHTSQECPKFQPINGRALSFKFPAQALTSSAQCGARREEAESGGGERGEWPAMSGCRCC